MSTSRVQVMGSAYESHGSLAATILGYLAEHPNASDSLEGICDWWIPRQKLLEARKDVQTALDLLVESGQVRTEASADGRILYRAQRDGEVPAAKNEPPPGSAR